MNKRIGWFMLSSTAYMGWLAWLCWLAPIRVCVHGLGWSAFVSALLLFFTIFKPLRRV